MTAPWTIGRVLTWAARDFATREVESPRFEAELLLASALGLRRIDLYLRHEQPLNDAELQQFRGFVERRRRHEPVAYILGLRAFYNRDFLVDARVLVPRPETEGVVDAALEALAKESEAPARVLDLCTGSGCIAVTLAAERPRSTVWAVDLSPGALAVASENAAKHGVSSRVVLCEGDLFGPLDPGLRFDVIVSNPPYIPHAVMAELMPDVRDHEPHLALDGGDDGLDLVRRVVAEAPGWLSPGGRLVVEFHYDQGPAVKALAESAGFASVKIVRDFGGHDRLVVATLG